MQDLELHVEKLRAADCSVLILGETGTGKSVLARRIHDIGARADGPFVDVNCAGLTREFVESELFGHERGAFTGAHAQKRGLFDAADRGTLFLDEIGDIDIQVQPKVLKAIEEKRYRRLGDVREHEADVRLLAATHHDLLHAVGKKEFRADLFYRISTVILTVPPLRERPGDILPLARQLLGAISPDSLELAPDAEQALLGYRWPGNIRELKNVLERALINRTGSMLREADIHFDVSEPHQIAVDVPAESPVSNSRLLASDASTATAREIEREHIQLALNAENGRVEAAARRLGVPRSTLYQKLKTFGITVTRGRKSREEK
jgi:transcriptional regulator with GAF, ATPase, and Fis domain